MSPPRRCALTVPAPFRAEIPSPSHQPVAQGSGTPVRPCPPPSARLRTSAGGVVSVALSVGSPRLRVTQHLALWSSDFPPPDEPGSGHPLFSTSHLFYSPLISESSLPVARDRCLPSPIRQLADELRAHHVCAHGSSQQTVEPKTLAEIYTQILTLPVADSDRECPELSLPFVRMAHSASNTCDAAVAEANRTA